MWRWLGFRCGRCREVRARRERALRSPVRPRLAICEECLEVWERTGHRCARCWVPIRDQLEVGLLTESGAFAHVDCGGARILGPLLAVPADRVRPTRWVTSGM